MEEGCTLDDLRKEIEELKNTIKPIAETYQTMSQLGTWAKGLLVAVSIIIGVLLGVRQLIGR